MISSVVALIVLHKHIFIYKVRMGHCISTAECEMHREAWCLHYEPHHIVDFLVAIFLCFIIVHTISSSGLLQKDRGWPFAVSSNARYL